MQPKTKIVCTIGPASADRKTLEKLALAGMTVARLNFSHGTYTEFTEMIKNIRKISEKLKTPIAILQDLQGPRIRTGKIKPEGIPIKPRQTVLLYPESQKKPAPNAIPIQYPKFHQEVKKEHRILIQDGTIELKVLQVKPTFVKARVVSGETIHNHKGINLPDSSISCPPLTTKDKKDLQFGLKHRVDFVALSFVKDHHHVLELKKLIQKFEKKIPHPLAQHLDSHNPQVNEAFRTKIIAKIERPEAYTNIDKIIETADAIMIARGDLGLEMPLQDVPIIQKEIITQCLIHTKPVIVATQMLESMIHSTRPTRAEVSDVANAIMDGTDAIMLSAETSIGKYPVRAVETMAKIARKTESHSVYKKVNFHTLQREILKPSITQAVTFSVKKLAEELNAKAIICTTSSGFTARSVARFKPSPLLFALTPSPRTVNQLNLSWGIIPYQVPFKHSIETLIQNSIQFLKRKKYFNKGDRVVVAAGYTKGYRVGRTNLIKVHIVR